LPRVMIFLPAFRLFWHASVLNVAGSDMFTTKDTDPMTAPLITDHGELDMLAIAQRSHARASADFGAPDYPPNVLRRWFAATLDRAHSERYAWRRDHGLSDDTETTLMPMPAWGGASGDGFGR
jgi:hypothetical protein